MAQPAISIQSIASMYCQGQSNVAMYQHALVLAQCDVMILRLRASGVALLDSIVGRPSLPGGTAHEDFPYGYGAAGIEKTTVYERLELDPAAARLRVPRKGNLVPSDRLDSIFHHIEVLSRLEDKLYQRRRRALRCFLALRKATVARSNACSKCQTPAALRSEVKDSSTTDHR